MGRNAVELTVEEKAARELEAQRRIWQNASRQGWLRKEAFAEMMVQVLAMLPGINREQDVVDTFDGVLIRIRKCFAVEAELSIRVRRQDFRDKVVNPDNPRQAVGTCAFEVGVNWAGTTRSLAAAQASVAIYQQLVNAGAVAQAVLESRTIRWFRDMDADNED